MKKSLVGQKFGKLTVISQAKSTVGGKRMWVCLCDCGKVKERPTSTFDLRSGKVRSCGCLYLDSNKGRKITHGKSNTRIYRIWSSMKQRCYYQKSVGFGRYGGRCVGICDEWRNDFESFYEWAMESGYNDSLTLDRIDNEKGYSPNNCRWADWKTQENNRGNNRRIEYNGQIYTMSQLSEVLGVPAPTLRWRLNAGWPDGDLGLIPSYSNKSIRR